MAHDLYTTSGKIGGRLERQDHMLILRFEKPQAMLSWAPARPGRVEADTIAWLQIRNADLPLGVDAEALLADRLDQAGLTNAVGLMTSRDIAHHHQASVRRGAVTASAVVTLGLSNGVSLRAGPQAAHSVAGTINLVCHVDAPLGDGAMLEAVSIAATARTAALLASNYEREQGAEPVIATGTDCIVIAAPLPSRGMTPLRYCGLHTDAGRAVLEACHAAVDEACRLWIAQWTRSGRPS